MDDYELIVTVWDANGFDACGYDSYFGDPSKGRTDANGRKMLSKRAHRYPDGLIAALEACETATVFTCMRRGLQDALVAHGWVE